MKRAISLALLAALLFTGCAAQTGPTNEELGWDKDWVRVGALLGVEPMDGFTLSENKDVMGIYGLYYATWTAGEARGYTNADGDEAQIYDAQIYVLLQQNKSADEARAALEDWMALEKKSYQTGKTLTETCAGQKFDLLPLLQAGGDNPYTHGVAAFAARDDWSISVELLCQDSFEGDVQACLIGFLSGFHYSDEQGVQ